MLCRAKCSSNDNYVRRCTARRSARISAILLGNSTKIVVKLLSEFDVWYIDDGTIGCIMSDILPDIRIIEAEEK